MLGIEDRGERRSMTGQSSSEIVLAVRTFVLSNGFRLKLFEALSRV